MRIYNKIHVLISTLSMFRRLLRHLQGEFYRTFITKNVQHTRKFTLKMAQ